MRHPDEGTIHAWLDDQLPPEERAELEQHFDQCEQCAVLVVEARGLAAGASRIVGALDSVRSGAVPPKKPVGGSQSKSLWHVLRLTPVRAAIAATLLLATATVFTVRQNGDVNHVPSPAAAMPGSAAAPAAGTAAAPAPTVANLAPPTAPETPRVVSGPTAKRGDEALASGSASTASEKARTNAVAQSVSAPRDSNPPAPPAVAGMAASRFAAADSTAADPRRGIAANARLPLRADSLPLRADSLAMRDARAAPAPQTPVSSQRRNFAGALSQIVATGMVQTTDPRAFGCYRLDVDSLRERFTSFRQFALSAPNGVNVVHALGPSGRPDSVIAGAVWRPLDRDSVAVLTPRSSPPATLVFALAPEGRSATGRLTANGQTTTVQVIRTRCP